MKNEVIEGYSKAAMEGTGYCCPVEYDAELLKIIPDEIIEKDYGCGDPSKYVKEGQTILDLGSGGGKICFMASQIVGKSGKVIGVDVNTDMISLARRYQGEIAEKLGYSNVEFKNGSIDNLRLDRDLAAEIYSSINISSVEDYTKAELEIDALSKRNPMIVDNSIDVVISNCVLNLVDDDRKLHLIKEIGRVLKDNGYFAISDIVSDKPVPEYLRQDKDLWIGCISGAFLESELIQHFIDAGFSNIKIEKRDGTPWRVIDNIEFRSITITGYKDISAACSDNDEAVMYKGPYSSISDDDGHDFKRGLITPVCHVTYSQLKSRNVDDFIFYTSNKNDVCSTPDNSKSDNDTIYVEDVNTGTKSSCC